jgi:membrane protein implicated in regulation of membrane protease activity
MLFFLAVLVFLVFPSPWDVIIGLGCAVLGVGEVAFWYRRSRGKAKVGVEQLVGATGEASGSLDPSGRVRVAGELWQARSSSAVPAGARVRVVAVQGLELEVEPVDDDILLLPSAALELRPLRSEHQQPRS